MFLLLSEIYILHKALYMKGNYEMYLTVESTKVWDTWNKFTEEMEPEREAAGMKFILKGCEMDEKSGI